MQAELDRVVISGARRGKEFTYALFDERVPPSPTRDRDEALYDLARRYFATRGPATAHDFAWWSGLSVSEAKRGIERAHLARETEDGRTYWSVPARRSARRWSRIAHLLPNFDEYFVGFKDRSAFAARLAGVVTKVRFDALMGHVLFVDGQIVGRWSRTFGKTAKIQVRLLLKLTPPEHALVRRAVQRFGQFLSMPVRARG